MVGLLNKRVLDVAGCNPELEVYLNGVHLKVDSFTDYAKRFLPSKVLYLSYSSPQLLP